MAQQRYNGHWATTATYGTDMMDNDYRNPTSSAKHHSSASPCSPHLGGTQQRRSSPAAKDAFAVTRYNLGEGRYGKGAGFGSAEIFPVVSGGPRRALKLQPVSPADDALIRRVLRKANAGLHPYYPTATTECWESEVEEHRHDAGGYSSDPRDHPHQCHSSRGVARRAPRDARGISSTSCSYDTTTSDSSDNDEWAAASHATNRQLVGAPPSRRKIRVPHEERDWSQQDLREFFRQRATPSPERRDVGSRATPSPKRRDGASPHGDNVRPKEAKGHLMDKVPHHWEGMNEAPHHWEGYDRGGSSMPSRPAPESSTLCDRPQAVAVFVRNGVVRSTSRQIRTPCASLVEPPLACLIVSEPRAAEMKVDAAINTSFAPSQQRCASTPPEPTTPRQGTATVEHHALLKHAVSVMTSPGLFPAPPVRHHVATSPVALPLESVRLPASSFTVDTVGGTELSSVRSNSVQSAQRAQNTRPAVSPYRVPERNEESGSGTTPRPSAPAARSPESNSATSPLDDGVDVLLASSSTNLIVSPTRRQTSVYEQTPKASPMHEQLPQSPWGEQQRRLAAVPEAYYVADESRVALPPPPQVLVDPPLEEYVVPAGRHPSATSRTKARQSPFGSGSPPTTKDVLQSYSHRSLFRPAREDIDAVRKLSSTLTSASFVTASSPHHTGSPKQTTGVESTWC